VHFLALDKAALPAHDLRPIFDNYLPAELTHEIYPNLIPTGTSVPTIANRALLVAYTWPENSPRHRKLVKFVRDFFGKIEQFHDGARHPKWKEINLSADIPGWTRFKPAADWLAEHRNKSNQQREFEAFLNSSDKQSPRGQAEREVLFREFMQWRDRQTRRQ
jgi:hypothetical protein